MASAATVLGAHGGLGITLGSGNNGFGASAITLGGGATLRDHADAVVKSGKMGWFEFGGDTWLINGQQTATPGFVDGSDFALKLAGAVDLSQARLVDKLLILPTTITFDSKSELIWPQEGQQLAGNDTFTIAMDAATPHLTLYDSLDGGDGEDTLNINLSGGKAYLAGMISHIETLNITSDDAVNLPYQKWLELDTLSVSSKHGGEITTGENTTLLVNHTLGNSTLYIGGGGDGTVNIDGNDGGAVFYTAGNGGNVLFNNKLSGKGGGEIIVGGGKHIAINQIGTNAVNTDATNSYVFVGAGPETETISVNNAPAAVASANIAGMKLSAVSLNDYNTGSKLQSASINHFKDASIDINGLKTLNLSNGSGQVSFIFNDNLQNPALDLHLNAMHITGFFGQGESVAKLNLHTNGTASSIDDWYLTKLSELSLDGTADLTISNDALFEQLDLLSLSGKAALIANFEQAQVLSIDASNSSGAHQLTLHGATSAYQGGSGNELITLTGFAPLHTISGGAGTDTLRFDAGLQGLGIGSDAAVATEGFEHLEIVNNEYNDVDLSRLGSFESIKISGPNALTLVSNDTGLTVLDASALGSKEFIFTGGAVTSALTLKGSTHGMNLIDVSAAKANVTLTTGSAADFIKVGNGNNVITTGGGGDTVILEAVNTDVNTYTSITDVTGSLALQMVTPWLCQLQQHESGAGQ